ncbi:YcaO-like family protein [Cupriavidus basilensis]|uniref:YcaO-like family protein n=1 Tax=Cupriavidus basilensis TaxID=68895 RepID=A0ABT6APU5_9BURK|nr:YcaO-like family protein [Cupriavidus basilensis]MDF3834644.1 YcaO-like family protein [Cupriavidus basilensis]
MLRFHGTGYGMPLVATLDANLSTRLPRFSWASDRLAVATSGAGLAMDSLRRCMGEYFERRHFFHEVRGLERKTLKDMHDSSLQVLLHEIMSQTSIPEMIERIDEHQFQISRAVTIPDFKEAELPTIFFSVSGVGIEADKGFVPARDTTGCAVHFLLPKAIDGAVRELIERQYLLRYWLTARGGIDVTDVVLQRLSPSAIGLTRRLTSVGTVKFIELATGEVEGAVVLAVYRGRNDPRVRYCVGLSFDVSTRRAADRALKELWQSYIFLHNMVRKEDIERLVHDSYHTYFLECNRLDVADAMLQGITRIATGFPDGDSTECTLLHSVYQRFGTMYLYVNQVRVRDRSLWCVRAVCPSAFLHIDNSRHLNLRNRFSEHFLADIHVERVRKMVPFP